jgi:16S rRNA (cytosine967-C5)-methyltransferase
VRPGARLAAAIEILTDVEARHRLAGEAVKDWMSAHRFAGSKDRAHVGDIVFGALRWRASSAWRFESDGPRAWALGALKWGFGEPAAAIVASFGNDPHAPEAITPHELGTLEGRTLQSQLAGAPPWVRGDYPEWLDASLARAFGDARAGEGAALAAPAPLDLRANTLKTTREELAAALSETPHLRAPVEEAPFAPDAVRLPWRMGGAFRWDADVSYAKGWFEVQDAGSQIAAQLAGARAGQQVLDLCAGGGGKTLALAALMQNKGQILAHDIDARRLAPIKARLDRAGARNVQIRPPQKSRDALADLEGRMDIVVVDAPCTGSGTWRRNPDSKWRLRPAALDLRRREQQEALDRAAALVKPGGRLVYITCSVLPEENADAVAALRLRHPQLLPEALAAAPPLRAAAHEQGLALQLTPARTGCDAFFIAALRKEG